MARAGVVEIVPGRNHRYDPIFAVIVKRSYRITENGRVERADSDAELRKIDEYYDDGDPEWSTVKYESELAPYKPSTDVVVIGKAHAPGGEPTQQMKVSVQVGDRKKVLVVTGNRQCGFREGATPTVSDPEPFVEMEIRYERAYGGRDEKSVPNIPFLYPRNFMGAGVVLRNVKEAVDGLALPNIEDPEDRLGPDRLFIEEPDRWHMQPLPQGFGWRQRTWYPRCALLGSYPPFIDPGTITAEERMGLLPKNHVALAKQSRLRPLEPEFANGASFGMIFTALKGDEPVTLICLTPEGSLTFSLPGETPSIGLDLGSGLQELPPQLHTVSVRSEEKELDLVWRGAAAFSGYQAMSKVTRLHAEVQ